MKVRLTWYYYVNYSSRNSYSMRIQIYIILYGNIVNDETVLGIVDILTLYYMICFKIFGLIFINWNNDILIVLMYSTL